MNVKQMQTSRDDASDSSSSLSSLPDTIFVLDVFTAFIESTFDFG